MSQIVLTSDTLASPATAGAIEYTSPVIYATPVGAQRGVVPNAQFYRLNADYAGANATGAQNVFGVGVTLAGSTVYAFETSVVFTKAAGVTSHTISLGFGGTATANNVLYELFSGGIAQAALPVLRDTLDYSTISTLSATVVTAAITTANRTQTLRYFGTISINAGGTFIPQYTLSAAPGGAYSTAAGSYFLIYPIGASGAAINVGTWL